MVSRLVHRLTGFVSILWGALALRLGIARPAPGSLAFFAFRRRWNERIAKRFHITHTVRGPVPTSGTLVVSNHSGFADINALASLIPAEAKTLYISKVEIGRIPIFGWHMNHYGDILFDRRNPEARKRVIHDALERLQAGFAVVLFPEGTRSKSGEPKPEIRPALIDAAIAAGILVQPVAIRGTLSLIEQPFSVMGERNPVEVSFGAARRDYKDAQEVWQDVLALFRGDFRADA